LLTASAHLRHRSRMQCNARACKTTLLRFCIQVPTDQSVLPTRVARRRCLRRAREFPVPYKDCTTVTCLPHRAIEQPARRAQLTSCLQATAPMFTWLAVSGEIVEMLGLTQCYLSSPTPLK